MIHIYLLLFVKFLFLQIRITISLTFIHKHALLSKHTDTVILTY